jgi:hypothetical protein
MSMRSLRAGRRPARGMRSRFTPSLPAQVHFADQRYRNDRWCKCIFACPNPLHPQGTGRAELPRQTARNVRLRNDVSVHIAARPGAVPFLLVRNGMRPWRVTMRNQGSTLNHEEDRGHRRGSTPSSQIRRDPRDERGKLLPPHMQNGLADVPAPRFPHRPRAKRM